MLKSLLLGGYVLFTMILYGCNSGTLDTSREMADNVEPKYVEPKFVEQNLTPLERDSDVIFRDLFAWHMEHEGFDQKATERAVFLTPPEFKQIPDTTDPSAFMAAITQRFTSTHPSNWYDYGVAHPAYKRVPKVPQNPVTIVVIPGIFGEFIDNFPFHDVLNKKNSTYFNHWGAAIEGLTDQVYVLGKHQERALPLGDVVKIGSYDIDGRPWVNVIVLVPKMGSLETLGTLDSAFAIYQRRLDKVFSVVPNDSDLYIMGYSRGTPVALEFVQKMSTQSTQHPWASKIKGIISLGGVYYGTKVADIGLADPKNPTGNAVSILKNLALDLQDRPSGSLIKAGAAGAKIIAKNTTLWRQALEKFVAINNGDGDRSLSTDAFDRERIERAKVETSKIQSPSILGNLNLIRGLMFTIFKAQCPISCYFDNVEAFKTLISKTLEGVKTLSVDTRMRWWKEHQLPDNLRILSITGTMPDATIDGKLSPLFQSPYYGKTSVDFNSTLRGSFYSVASAEGTDMNDSQVTNYRSRYWPALHPDRKNKSYYLGSFGTHHWGFAFRTAINNVNGEGNEFPRGIMLATIASFIEEIDADESR